MDIIQIIRESPEWVALFVAMGGLGFQQAQITHMDKKLSQCQQFLEERVGSLEAELKAVYRKLLKRTDL